MPSATMGGRDAFDHIAHLLCELYLRQEAVGLGSDVRRPLALGKLDPTDAMGLSNVHVNRALWDSPAAG